MAGIIVFIDRTRTLKCLGCWYKQCAGVEVGFIKKLRSILLLILISAVVMTSLYLLYNRYKHDRGLTQIHAQQSGSSTQIQIETGKETDTESGSKASTGEGTEKVEEQKAYNFELEDINGKKIKLSDYKGKRIVLNFWMTWSPYCIDEMPDLQSVSDKLKDGKEAVLLTIDVSEDAETVKKFVEDNKLTLPVLLDKTGETAQIYGIQGFPTTVFINSDGTVYEQIPLATDEVTILAMIDKMK